MVREFKEILYEKMYLNYVRIYGPLVRIKRSFEIRKICLEEIDEGRRKLMKKIN